MVERFFGESNKKVCVKERFFESAALWSQRSGMNDNVGCDKEFCAGGRLIIAPTTDDEEYGGLWGTECCGSVLRTVRAEYGNI